MAIFSGSINQGQGHETTFKQVVADQLGIHPNDIEYIQGDRTLRTIRCRTCGCVTHWEPLQPTPGAKHGVHLGNFDPALIASVRVRRFDGANTWTFIDE